MSKICLSGVIWSEQAKIEQQFLRDFANITEADLRRLMLEEESSDN